MFIKTIVKTDKKTGKRYEYYRLCESYRMGNKSRHRIILTLGKLEGIHTKESRKLLADRIEAHLRGQARLFPFGIQAIIEKYARRFAKEIMDKKLQEIHKKVDGDKKGGVETAARHEVVDLDSMEHTEVREIGSEWMCKQALGQLQLHSLLTSLGSFTEHEANTALMHIISRAVYPASEHKTAQWIRDCSSVSDLCNVPARTVNRFRLHEVTDKLYQHKDRIEQYLSVRTNELFDIQDKIVFYDLTNTYFEGRKAGSKIAKFGRSKEKRNDARIVALATVINAQGFIKYSKIYRGNISDSTTLEKTLEELSTSTSESGRKPLVVMDAGIITEENTKMLTSNGYDYLCVSRSRLKEYQLVHPDQNPVMIHDKRNNPIELKLVNKPDFPDTYLYVHSQQKAQKEGSMNQRFSQLYEDTLEDINHGLGQKGRVKKYDKVCERIGRLKEKYPTANKHYKIQIIPDQDKNKAIEVKWERLQPQPRSTEGVYFIRTSLDTDQEKLMWTIYNTLTEIEATFRVLKTDLWLRPVFHKKDERVESHIFLGVLAYQLVATIRYQLKRKNIHHDWRNIVRIMNTQKEVSTSMVFKQGGTLHLKKCSAPSADAKEIYEVLGFKQQPYFMKKSVVPE